MPLRINLPVLLMIALSGFVICGCASAGLGDLWDNIGVGIINSLENARTSLNLNSIPPMYDPYWDELGPNLRKEGLWSLADNIPFVPTQTIRVFAEHGTPKSWPWGYDPFWDDMQWALIQDNVKILGNTAGIAVNYESGSTIFSDIANFPYESTGAIKIVSVPGIGMVKDTDDIADAIDAVISTGRTLQEVDSGIQNMNKAAELAQQGLGTPQLSPSTSGTSWYSDQNKERSDVPETSGSTYIDKANNVWYIDAFSWSGDRSLYDKPAAPYRFISGEINTYGYNWIYLPFERTGMTYDQGYGEWVSETLASMGMSAPSAGYGLLIDEGQNGGGGW